WVEPKYPILLEVASEDESACYTIVDLPNLRHVRIDASVAEAARIDSLVFHELTPAFVTSCCRFFDEALALHCQYKFTTSSLIPWPHGLADEVLEGRRRDLFLLRDLFAYDNPDQCFASLAPGPADQE